METIITTDSIIERPTIEDFVELSHVTVVPMHAHDFVYNYNMKVKYLGRDVDEEQAKIKFDALSEKDKKEQQNHGYEGNEICRLADKTETIYALFALKTLTAREILKSGQTIEDEKIKKNLVQEANCMDRYQKITLRHTKNILTNFPDGKITQEKITEALTPFPV